MDPMMSTSLIIAGSGSIAGAAASILVSRVLERHKPKRFLIRFNDGQTKRVDLAPDADADETERAIRKVVAESATLSKHKAFGLFLCEAVFSIAGFLVFVMIAKALGWLGGHLDMQGLVIVFRIIERTTQVLGGILCATLVLRNIIHFLTFLMREPQQSRND